MDEITVVGVINSAPVGGTSKSAHEALEIQTKSDSYIFRIIGENPFEMSRNHQNLCGKLVRASGVLSGKVLMVRSFNVE